MRTADIISLSPFVGIIGFGAFGRLTADHLRRHFRICASDPAFDPGPAPGMPDVDLTGLETAARCPVVILAVPVSAMAEVATAIAPLLRPDALVLDVGSVKVLPAKVLAETLPPGVEVVATHPLFGPQSGRDGIRGLKIAVCPVRGRSAGRVAAFLRRVLGLRVIPTTPQAHDAEVAVVQGLTHLIANVLVRMEPLPTRLTTRSFDLLKASVDMVRDDAPEVFRAIEADNPYAARVRRRFCALAADLDAAWQSDGAAAPEAPKAGPLSAPRKMR